MRLTRPAAIVAAALIQPSATLAQDGILQGWDHGQVSIYGWLPGITGSQEAPDGQPFVDLDNADVLDALDMAFFGAAEIRKANWGLVFDFEYADLDQDGTADRALIPGAEPVSGSVGTTLAMTTGFAAYRFAESDRHIADVYAGIRAFNVEGRFSFDADALGYAFDRKSDVSWLDPIIGLRGHADLGRRFGVTGLADVGGFGIGDSSDLTWQVTGTLDYAFTDRIDGRIGYRYMSIDYDAPGLGLDLDLYGPLVGVTWTF
jgi:opacity protein-like surface antigen